MVSFLLGVIWFALNGGIGWGGQVDGGWILMGGAFCLEGALYWKDYMLALLVCIFGRNSLCFERAEWDGGF